jgi:hypothetical protein
MLAAMTRGIARVALTAGIAVPESLREKPITHMTRPDRSPARRTGYRSNAR